MNSKIFNDDYEAYLKLATTAVLHVFENEYYGLLALPLPKIGFVPPEHKDHITGQYYISIGDGWQIHLNFGQLPKRKKAFIDEVKVLLRHEIEHYQSCPFDIISYLRMIKTIIRTNKYSDEGLAENQIVKYAKSIANQFADVIVDSVNFQKHPKQTLVSEIAWVKKGNKEEFATAPRSSKLMFLLKEAIWGENMQLFENEKATKEAVHELATLIKKGGVNNRTTFQKKVEAFTTTYLKLVHIDKEDPILQQKLNDGNNLSSKRDDEVGDSIIFENPDGARNALIQLAQESTLQEFLDIVEAVGLKQLSEDEKKVVWYKARSVDEIPIIEALKSTSEQHLLYPERWSVGDPIEDIDLVLTIQTIPKVIPGVSTMKWAKQPEDSTGGKKSAADLLLVIDSSGSMGNVLQEGSKMQEAILASFGFVQYFERKGSEIALLNYSTKTRIERWTSDYELIRKSLLLIWGQGTSFPIDYIKQLTTTKSEKVVLVAITDGEIENWESTVRLFHELLLLEHKIFIFLMGDTSMLPQYSELKNMGGFVEHASTAKEIRDTVFNELHTQGFSV